MRLGERQIAEESAPPQLLADETARRMSAWRLKALEVAQAKAARTGGTTLAQTRSSRSVALVSYANMGS